MLPHEVLRRNTSNTSPAGETSRTWSPRWSPVRSDPLRAHLGASPLLTARVTSGATHIRHFLKELKNETWDKTSWKFVGARLRGNSPSHAANSDNTSVHVARGSSSYKKEWCGWRGWPLEPLKWERGANAAAVGTFRVLEVVEWIGTLDWTIGLVYLL